MNYDYICDIIIGLCKLYVNINYWNFTDCYESRNQ